MRAHSRRNYNAVALGPERAISVVDSGGEHQAGPARQSKTAPVCQWLPQARNPDASLYPLDVCATALGVRRGGRPRAGSIGSAGPLGATIRRGAIARTAPHSRCCRGRSCGKCALVPRSAHNCRVDALAPPTPCMPSQKHWTMPGNTGIKTMQTLTLVLLLAEGPGFCSGIRPGLRFLGIRAQHNPALTLTAHSLRSARINSHLVHIRGSTRNRVGQFSVFG
jgi:hypothetical protein